MTDRTHCPFDFEEALKQVDKLLAAHEPRHQGAWRRQSVVDHVTHSWEHANSWLKGDSTNAESFEDLKSLACRSLMALQIAIENRKDPI